MTKGKNIASALLAAFLALIFISYAVFAAMYSGSDADISQYFSYNNDGTMTFFGENYIIDENITREAENYLLLCRRINGKIFPRSVSEFIKSTVYPLSETVLKALSDLRMVFSELIYGKM